MVSGAREKREKDAHTQTHCKMTQWQQYAKPIFFMFVLFSFISVFCQLKKKAINILLFRLLAMRRHFHSISISKIVCSLFFILSHLVSLTANELYTFCTVSFYSTPPCLSFFTLSALVSLPNGK